MHVQDKSISMEESGHLSCKGGRLGSLSEWMVVISYWDWNTRKKCQGLKAESTCLEHFECEVPIHYSGGNV